METQISKGQVAAVLVGGPLAIAGFQLAAIDQASDGSWGLAWVLGSIVVGGGLFVVGTGLGSAIAQRAEHNEPQELSSTQRRRVAVGGVIAAFAGPVLARYAIAANASLLFAIAGAMWLALGVLIPLIRLKLRKQSR